MHNASYVSRLAALAAAAIVALTGVAMAGDAPSAADLARFVAGLPPSAGSPLEPLTKDAGWQRHAKSFDQAWQSLDKTRLAKIRSWSSQNLTAPETVLFYMFSGPDFLYADAFFPKADTYVLSGLEPVGQVPNLAAESRGAVDRDLQELRGSLSSVMSLSFFITKNMKKQLHTSNMTGTLPILYTFLARSGHAVRETAFVELDDQGAVHPGGDGASKSRAKGVKITFDGDGRTKTLYYFSTDLSNDGFKTSGFQKFCDNLGRGDAFVKSASYLMHNDSFATVRDFVVAHSVALVQDDSGVPVRYLKQDDWDLKPFGNYLQPISIFPRGYQTQLNAVFKKGPKAPLDFGIGYRWRPRESNLLLAMRKDSKRAQSTAK